VKQLVVAVLLKLQCQLLAVSHTRLRLARVAQPLAQVPTAQLLAQVFQPSHQLAAVWVQQHQLVVMVVHRVAVVVVHLLALAHVQRHLFRALMVVQVF
jgi:hypothetical protein